MSTDKVLMTAEQIQELAKQIALHGLPPRWEEWGLLILILFVGAALSAYIGAFFAKRGEIKAISRSLDTILAETKALTVATGTINSNLSRLDWVEQRKWEIKQKYYWGLISKTHRQTMALQHYITTLREFEKIQAVITSGKVVTQERLHTYGEARKDAYLALTKARDEIFEAQRYAGVILSKEVSNRIEEYLKSVKSAAETEGIPFWESVHGSSIRLEKQIQLTANEDLQMNLHDGSNALAKKGAES